MQKANWKIINCPKCAWMMRIPQENKMTNIQESLKIHMNFSHKN